MSEPSHLNLFPNGAVTFDPAFAARGDWPNPATLAADINLELTRYFLTLQESRPEAAVLSALYGLTGQLAFSVSFYHLGRKGGDGVRVDPHKPMTMFEATSQRRVLLSDWLVGWGQKILISFRRWVTTGTGDYYAALGITCLYRLRRYESIPDVFCVSLSAKARAAMETLAADILSRLSEIAQEKGINIDPDVVSLWRAGGTDRLIRAAEDLAAYRRFFKGFTGELFERSTAPYHTALMSVAVRENGGRVHGSYHGVCQTASEPDVYAMVACTDFHAPAPGFAADTNELAARIPPGLNRFSIHTSAAPDYHCRFLKPGAPRTAIKRVAIIGRHVVMRYSAFNVLEFPFYLTLEQRFASLLLDAGYEVTYKAHPESNWRHFGDYMDPRVQVDWRPFEPTLNEYDAVFFHFGASSVVPYVLGSPLHVFMLADGWHDRRIWTSRQQAFFKEHTNAVPAKIGADGLPVLNAAEIRDIFARPRPVDPEKRIYDFFHTVY
jgi:hypothetical protein